MDCPPYSFGCRSYQFCSTGTYSGIERAYSVPQALVEDLNREKNRGHMVLQNAGIKLTSVIKEIYEKSGRALLYALVEDKRITESLILACVYTTLRRKLPQMIESLEGSMTPHYRNMLALHLLRSGFYSCAYLPQKLK